MESIESDVSASVTKDATHALYFSKAFNDQMIHQFNKNEANLTVDIISETEKLINDNISNDDPLALYLYSLYAFLLWFVQIFLHENQHTKRDMHYDSHTNSTPTYDGEEGGLANDLRAQTMAMNIVKYNEEYSLEPRYIYKNWTKYSAMKNSSNPLLFPPALKNHTKQEFGKELGYKTFT